MPTPKKRGRKPKKVDPNAVKKVPKKRGRKPKEKYSAKPAEPVPNHEENYILHIPNIQEQNIIINEDNQPAPFDTQESINELINNDMIENPEVFNSTCMWCCHNFLTQNWGLPFYKQKDLFKTYGNFCSPECSAAYCFDDISSTDDRKWEIFSMINDIARQIYDDTDVTIKLAPPRNSLKMFGGKYSIEEFKDISIDKTRVVKVYLPPTISIVHSVEEETDKTNLCNIKNNITIQQDERYKLIQDNLKLKRDKPLLNKKNTLEHCMKIEIS